MRLDLINGKNERNTCRMNVNEMVIEAWNGGMKSVMRTRFTRARAVQQGNVQTYKTSKNCKNNAKCKNDKKGLQLSIEGSDKIGVN